MRSDSLFGDDFVQPLVSGAAANDFELVPNFLAQEESERLFTALVNKAAWQEEHLQMFGRRIRSPRRVCWYGEPGVGYVYSGEPHFAGGWLPEFDELRNRLESLLETPFNFVLANLYKDHNDSMGWHADNEPELGPRPVIASVSLGAPRTFRVRSATKTAGVRRTSQSIPLANGSLLIMRGESQTEFQHALPKSTQPCDGRINLTFRCVKTAPTAVSE